MTKREKNCRSVQSPSSKAGLSDRAVEVLRRAGAMTLETLENRLFLSTTPAEAALDPNFNQPAGQLGINLNNSGPLDSSALWTDASKNFSSWQYAGTATALSGSDVTQFGFPSGTAASNNATAYSYMLGYPNGAYDLQYQGTGTIGVSGIGSIVPGSITYNASTDTTFEVVNVQQNQQSVPLVMTASGLQSSDPIRNLQMLMPGFSPGTTQIVNPSVASRLGAFATIRLMDAFNTNSDTIANWSQLTSPGSFSFAGPSGVSYEDAIALANATHSNLWWNIPVYATDAFVTNLANLFKYGADANGNPYSSTQANPVYAPLNAGLKVHIEYGNELENFTQPAAVGNNILANYNVSAGILDGSLQIDGEEELFKLHQMYNLFQAVYSPGGSGFSSQIGFVFAGAFSSSGADAFTSGAFTFAAENNGQAGQLNPANWGPISSWMEAVATSDYQGLVSGQNPTNLDQVFQNLNTNLLANSNTAAKTFVSQSSINVPLYGYEGGQGLVGTDSTTSALYFSAQSDPRMGAFYQALIDQWYTDGGSLFNLYSYAAPYTNGSAWGLLQSTSSNGSPKWDAAIQRLVPLADANLDGNVDYSDFQILQANFSSTSAAWQIGDFNGDGKVDKKDLALLQQTINTSNFTSAQLTAYNNFVNAVTNSTTPSTPGTPTVSVAPTTTTVSINWSASFDSSGISSYLVFRNGVQVGTSTTNSYSDTGLAAGNTYLYTIEAVDASSNISAASAALSVTTALPLINLTGSVLGTPGSYNNSGNTAASALDGNIYTYFDAPGPNGNWVGLDLHSAQTITAISYAPRSVANGYAYETRMVGGQFQYASDANFTNPVTFYTIFSTPTDGYTPVTLSTPVTAEFVRYLAPANSYGNVAEIQFDSAGSPTAPKAPGTPTLMASTTTTATISWTGPTGAGVSQYLVFRNNVQIGTTTGTTYTFSDSGLNPATTYSYTVEAIAGGLTSPASGALSITTPSVQPLPPATPTLTSSTSTTATIGWTASSSAGVTQYIVLRNNAQIGMTNGTTFTYSDSGLTASTTYNYTVEAVAGGATSAPSGILPVTTPPAATSGQLTGTIIGTTGSYDGVSTSAKAFDGNAATFFDAPTANGNWVGLDLGSAYTITSVSYVPRAASGGFAYEPRMIGGIFQASNTADFSSGVVNLFTVTAQPPDTTTTQAVSSGAYRYVRYLAPAGSYGNVAELAFFGSPVTGTQPPGTPTLTSSTSTTATIGWAASPTAGVTQYVVLRNNAQIGTTNGTTFTYSDSGLTASTTYNYTVEAVAGGVTSAASGVLPVTTPPAGASGQLTGTIIGTTGSYDGVSTSAKAFDGNTATFFDAPTANGNWVGLDLGSAYAITSVSYVPRAASGGFAYEGRMVGGIFQASNTADFSSGVVNLFTVTTQPGDASTTQSVSSGAYRYVRYLAPAGSYGNVAELAFFGTPATATQAPGTPTLSSSTSTTATIAWAASPTANVSQYVVLRNNVQIGTTNGTTFTYGDTGLAVSTTYTYTVEAVAGGDTSAASGALSVTTPAGGTSSQLTGTIIGTTGSYDGVSTIAKVFDGNTGTFFDASTANGNWVGLDLGTARTITSVSYAPRVASGGFQYEPRMVGGIFQVSNAADFSSGVVNLYTISSTPKDGYNTVSVSAPGTYRYIRYLAPAGSYGNVAELQFFGF